MYSTLFPPLKKLRKEEKILWRGEYQAFYTAALTVRERSYSKIS